MAKNDASQQTPGLFRLAGLLWQITPRVERLRLAWLVVAMLLVAVVEIGSLAVIQQYLSFVTEGKLPTGSLAAQWITAETLKGQLFILSVGVLAVILIKLLVGLLTNRALAIIVARNRIVLATRLFRAYQFAPFTWHSEQDTAALQRNLLQDVGQVSGSITLQFLLLILNTIVSLAVFGFILITLSLELLLIIAVVGGILSLIATLAQKVLIKASAQARDATGMMLKVIREGLGALTEIRILGRGEVFVSYFRRSQNQLGWAQRRRIFLMHSVPLVMENLIMIALIMIIAYMVITAENVETAFASATILTIALFRLRQALTKIVNAVNGIGSASASLSPLVRDLENLEPWVDRVPSPVTASGDGFAEFRFADVSFSFPNQDKPAIRSVSMVLRRGEHLAVMGQTGAGKSTFLSLMLGLLDAGSGRITVDDQPLDQRLAEWNAQIGYVPQSVFLIADTISANVAFGLPKDQRDPERIRLALLQAQALDFVEALPQGINTPLGENGGDLSGGQRQRIGIARALFRQPTVLVLDEATSALDRDTQFRVMKAVSSLTQNPTVISVTHQLEPLEYASRLLLLDAGQLVEDGPIEEVRTTQAFRRIARLDDLKEGG